MIKGNIINLRPIGTEDLELFYMWYTSPEYKGEYMNAEMFYKETFIEKTKQSFSSDSSFMMIIEDKDGKALGVVNYKNSTSSTVSVDIGILIADKASRGRGVGKEAITLWVNYLFNTKNISRIQYMTRIDNEGARQLGEKLGFKLDGVLRKYIFDHGICRDVCLYSLIREDW